jgi:hypothetical protein
MTIMVGCTRAGTRYAKVESGFEQDGEEQMVDANGDFNEAYYKVVAAYNAELPELEVHQHIYGRVNGLQYMVTHVGPVSFECMDAYSTAAQRPLRMPISMFGHNFSETKIIDSQILDKNLRLMRKAWSK